MPLQLTGTRDHALLAMIAQIVAENPDSGYLGRVALGTILYFSQVAGVPMRYRFDIYPDRVHCDWLARDVGWLLADEVLQDASPSSEKYPNYRLGAGAEELIRSQATALEPHRATITKVVRSLLPLQPDHLELVILLSYVFRWLKAGGGSGPWKEPVIARLLELKKDKFTRQAVADTYDSMLRADLIEA